jgi:hypothetical protein
MERNFIMRLVASVAVVLLWSVSAVATIRTLLPANADSWDKVEVVRKFIYDSGLWNDKG